MDLTEFLTDLFKDLGKFFMDLEHGPRQVFQGLGMDLGEFFMDLSTINFNLLMKLALEDGPRTFAEFQQHWTLLQPLLILRLLKRFLKSFSVRVLIATAVRSSLSRGQF